MHWLRYGCGNLAAEAHHVFLLVQVTGLKACYAIPLTRQGHVVSVVVFYSRSACSLVCWPLYMLLGDVIPCLGCTLPATKTDPPKALVLHARCAQILHRHEIPLENVTRDEGEAAA